MNRWHAHSLTFRLACWHAGVALLVVLVLAWFVREVVEHRLRAELDRQLRIDYDIVEGQIEVGADNRLTWPLRGAHGEEGYARMVAWFEVWNEAGRLLLRHWPVPETVAHARPGVPDDGGLRFYSAEVEPGLVARIMERPGHIGGVDVRLRVLRDTSGMRLTLAELERVFFVGMPLAGLLAFGGGWWLARRSLRPIGDMAARADAITARSLGQRLPVANPHDELGRLGLVFNNTLRRLENSFVELRRFTADASHELRTPLTALRAAGEIALRNARDPHRLREAIAAMLADAQRMQDLVDALLELARSETERTPPTCTPLDLAAFAREAVESIRVLAEDKGLTLQCDAPPDDLSVATDPALLRHAVLNLLDNAIRHTPAKGTVTLELHRKAQGGAVLVVGDTGEGIAPEHHPHLFDRFYRVDKIRSRATGGAGLGLAIARAAVERLDGRISVQSTPGHGSRFRIELPAPAGSANTPP